MIGLFSAGSSPEAARIVEDTLREAITILWDSLPPDHRRADAVIRLKKLLGTRKLKSALAKSSDTLFSFTVREANKIVGDRRAWPDKIISELWTVLDDPHLIDALGIPRNAAPKLRKIG